MSKITSLANSVKRISQTIASIITLGWVSNPDDDKNLNCVLQCESKGKTSPVGIFSPYGLSSNAPIGATLLYWSVGGSAQGKAGYASFPENRFRDLKQWEVAIGNYKTKAHILFAESGEVFFNESSFENAEDYMVRYSELKKGFDDVVTYINSLADRIEDHAHISAAAGVITTQSMIGTIPAPVPLLIPNSIASVNNAKIEQYRVPGIIS